MHPDETWQQYALNGAPIVGEGWSARLGNPHIDDDVRCGIAIVILYRQDGEETELLFQQRSMKVDNPGKWDVSAGGHINNGEDLLDAAVREAKEEIGVKIDKSQLQLVCSDVFCNVSHTFLYDWTGREDEFVFDDEEVMAIRWVKASKLDEFWRTELKDYLAKDEIYLATIKRFMKLHGYIEE